ncbi:alpha/beta fold hydrolase [Nocardia seriolae]|uniref:Alpha/beta hydrolase n=1 Tax=Nocardia seriolae TaxID=37332 RepID=A0A0B8NA09_9NOCA|nr:alpha/beta hydrolase [Nocardia seriolae]GEM26817.1 alpha/beta hydrolase [Nocardia seriolae NBRC 15557]MTJ62072.1 alpha/beta fold hydrolase [Nocardia seriolae]MTJ75200.1 alpha/beta fold hydrolase [Nocardia seriolae]MTJ89902.1 alpha/beta fold hydrolase [Nocardia seriolae]MTK33876.1 alpha/beta fold hydrolase [Nocardia seriolae]
MHTVTSADGTTIAYHRAGNGPAIVFLPGAFNDSDTCAPLAEQLRDRYTVIRPDRRGRGASTDAIAPADAAGYDPRREIEDLDAVLADIGGSAAVFGFSSGAILALRAAVAGSRITRLALYEPPFALAGLSGHTPQRLPERLADLIARGERGAAVELMQLEGIGLPAELIAQVRQSPLWPRLEAIAQTVVYDAAICRPPNLPTPAMAELTIPALVLSSPESWPGVRSASEALPARLPDARYVAVPGGVDHGIPAEATAKVLDAFLTEG